MPSKVGFKHQADTIHVAGSGATIVLASEVRLDSPMLIKFDLDSGLVKLAVSGIETGVIKEFGLRIGDHHHAAHAELPLDPNPQAIALGGLAVDVAEVHPRARPVKT